MSGDADARCPEQPSSRSVTPQHASGQREPLVWVPYSVTYVGDAFHAESLTMNAGFLYLEPATKAPKPACTEVLSSI